MDNLFKTEDPGRCLGIRLRLGLPVLTVFKDVMRKKCKNIFASKLNFSSTLDEKVKGKEGWAELFLAEIEKAGLVLAEFEVIGRPLLASKNELQSRLLLKTQF
ncbi:hypothetical protein PPACK8108_LOCUS1868, partial [Phakopsora pachyrhizi]